MPDIDREKHRFGYEMALEDMGRSIDGPSPCFRCGSVPALVLIQGMLTDDQRFRLGLVDPGNTKITLVICESCEGDMGPTGIRKFMEDVVEDQIRVRTLNIHDIGGFPDIDPAEMGWNSG